MTTPSLRTGTILGSYRVVAPLGAGSMGEVYKAHDAKLDRAVALKVLPAELVRDADRVRRFVQEARAASSLSHPNIVTIHDIGQAVPASEDAEPLPDAAPVHYIAMELVDGATMRQLFAGRSVEPRTLLAHLAQAAEGLAKAHAAGIVHRDLKPENIMVTRDGYAKVLDFGLAKLTEPDAAGGALTAAPTALPAEITRAGAVMGTAGYMSPEQAMGRAVDHRTDVFAFGCLLYEAATGRRPFTGESTVDVLHAVVRGKPEPVEAIAPEIPVALVRTIRRCLAKDPDRRYQSMKDLALELHDMVDEWDTLATPTGTVSSASAAPGPAGRRRSGLGHAGWAAVGIGAVAIAAAAVLWRGAGRARPPGAAFQAMSITAATASGDVHEAALGPAGRYLAYVRSGPDGKSLWLRQLTSASDVQLLPPQGGLDLRHPVFTPDGGYIDYTLSRDEGATFFTLYRIPVLGGTPRRILQDVDTPVSYAPDGTRFAFLRGRSDIDAVDLVIAAADGSTQKTLVSRRQADNELFLIDNRLGPAWSPDGRTIAAVAEDARPQFQRFVELVDAASGAQRRVGDANWYMCKGLSWLPDGTGLVIAGFQVGKALAPQLWHLGVPGGVLTRITNDSNSYVGASLGADGAALASVQWVYTYTLWSRPLGGSGKERQLTSSTREGIRFLRTAGDGTVFFSSWLEDEAVINRLDPGAGRRVRVTSRELWSRDCEVSRDGNAVVVRTLMPDGAAALVAMDRDGGNQRRLPERGAVSSYAVSPDGTKCAVRDDRGIWLQPLDGGPAELLVDDPAAYPVAYSPDGGRLAYAVLRGPANGAGNRLLVMPAGGGIPMASLPWPPASFESVHWAPDGAGFTFLRKEGSAFNVWRQPLDGGAPVRITGFDSFEMGSYALAPDGRTIYYTKVQSASDAVVIRNFR